MTDDEFQEAHHLVALLSDGLKMARLAVYGVGRKPLLAGTDTETLAGNLGALGSPSIASTTSSTGGKTNSRNRRRRPIQISSISHAPGSSTIWL
jgi:hypothetical protein